jgi:GNAT superfamily N-acetyltransferase
MTTPSITVRLRASDRAALERHFTRLGGEDRRLRFGSNISDQGLHEYVERIDFERDGLFAVHDDEGANLLAVIHVAASGPSAELGLSVLPEYRVQGLGSALFARAVTYLRNRGIAEVFVHCLSENGAMMHLARKNHMRIVPEGPETDARLALAPATAHTFFAEWMHDSQAAAVTTLRTHARMVRTMLDPQSEN